MAPEIVVDHTVLTFNLIVSLLAVGIFGLLPALQASKLDLSSGLSEGGRGGSTGTSPRRLRSALVVGEIALSIVLLVGAGTLIQTLVEEVRQNLGFDPGNVLAVQLNPSSTRYRNDSGRMALFRKCVEALQTLPGVESAAATSDIPAIYGSGRVSFRLEGQSYASKDQEPWARHYIVSPDYFHTMAIPVIEGRTFLSSDDGEAPLVALVSRTFAERFFPHNNPIGHHVIVETGQPGTHVSSEIVGVVGDVRDWRGQPEFDPEIYESYQQRSASPMTLLVRAASSPSALASSMRQMIQSVDKDQPVGATQTLPRMLEDAAGGDWLMSELMSAFACLALGLAGVGIFGVVAYSVAQRTREVGIRMALGATKHEVVQLVVGDGALLTLLGVAIGLAGAYPVPRVLEGAFTGLQVNTALVLAVAASVVAVVALLASYIPAHRATKVDPMVALRYE